MDTDDQLFGRPTGRKAELGKDGIQQQLNSEFSEAITRIATAIAEGK